MPKMTQKENLIRTIKRDYPQWIPYRYDGSLTTLEPAVIPRAIEGGLDDWGVNWMPSGTDEGSYPDEKPALSLADAEQFKAPETDWQNVTEELKKQIAEKSQVDTLIIVRNELVLFERLKYLLGTTECLMGLITNPKQTHLLLDKILDYQIKLTRCIMESGVAGVRFTDDWGIQNSLFISPAQWREFIKPLMKEMYMVVKEYDGIVFQHSCGHLKEIMPDFIEIGLDVLDPCQPSANDIFSWKEQYGNSLKVLAYNRMESDATDFNASPAVSPGHLLLRSNRFVYCIGRSDAEGGGATWVGPGRALAAKSYGFSSGRGET